MAKVDFKEHFHFVLATSEETRSSFVQQLDLFRSQDNCFPNYMSSYVKSGLVSWLHKAKCFSLFEEKRTDGGNR